MNTNGNLQAGKINGRYGDGFPRMQGRKLMSSSGIVHSAFRLASAVVLVVLAGIKQLPFADLPSWAVWQCAPAYFASFVRLVVWAFSDHGRAIITASLAFLAVWPFLRGQPWPEAKEVAIAIVVLLVFLVAASVKKEAYNNEQVCAQVKAKLDRPGPAKL